MEAVPIHRSPSSPSLSSRSSLSNTLGGDTGALQRPPSLITRIKGLSVLTRFPSRKLNVHSGHDLPVAVVVPEGASMKLAVHKPKTRKRNLRNKTKEWLLAALTIIMGGFIAGVFVITGIESAASSMRHKYVGSRWNSSSISTIPSLAAAPTDPSSQTLSLSPVATSHPLDPTEIPYAIEVMPDLTKLTACSNPTVDDGVAFVSIAHIRNNAHTVQY